MIRVTFVPAKTQHRAIRQGNASTPVNPLAINPGTVRRMVHEPELLSLPMQGAVPGGNVITRNFNICVDGGTQYRREMLDFGYARTTLLAQIWRFGILNRQAQARTRKAQRLRRRRRIRAG